MAIDYAIIKNPLTWTRSLVTTSNCWSMKINITQTGDKNLLWHTYAILNTSNHLLNIPSYPQWCMPWICHQVSCALTTQWHSMPLKSGLVILSWTLSSLLESTEVQTNTLWYYLQQQKRTVLRRPTPRSSYVFKGSNLQTSLQHNLVWAARQQHRLLTQRMGLKPLLFLPEMFYSYIYREGTGNGNAAGWVNILQWQCMHIVLPHWWCHKVTIQMGIQCATHIHGHTMQAGIATDLQTAPINVDQSKPVTGGGDKSMPLSFSIHFLL